MEKKENEKETELVKNSMKNVFVYQKVKDIIKANVINTMNVCKGFVQNNCNVHFYVTHPNFLSFYEKNFSNSSKDKKVKYVINKNWQQILVYLKAHGVKTVYTRGGGEFAKFMLESIDSGKYDGYVIWEDHNETPPKFINLMRQHKRLIFTSISPVVMKNFNVTNQIVFPCSIDFDYFSDSTKFDHNKFNKDKINVTYCGHLYDYKGIPLVIKAMERFPNVNFHFVGGKDRDIKINKERTKHLKNVTFWGHQNYANVPNYLYSSDILLIPYDRRGNVWSKSYVTSPIKLFEYLSTKVPVLCSSIAGIANWVSGKEVTYYKVNNVDEFCKKLQYLMDNLESEELRAIRENGFKLAEKYSTMNKCKTLLDKVFELNSKENEENKANEDKKVYKIVVTGCAGFIASHTCERLLKEGHVVVGIDNLNDYYDVKIKENNVKLLESYKNFTFYKEDIRDTDVITRVKPDKVCHLASTAGVRYSIQNPSLYVDVNINGFINILEECHKNGIEQLVYASSSSVYGLNKKVPFSEDDPIKTCNSPYATSKLAMEMYARTYYQLYKLKSIGLRFFTVYGPRGRPDMAPYKFLKAIMKGEKFQKYGDGTSSRDYTYIDDIVSGIINSLENSKKLECEIFNLGNSNPVTLNEFIDTCSKVVGKDPIYDQIGDQLGDVPHTFADISKAKELIGYNPQTVLQDGLKNTYEYLRSIE